MISAYCVHNMMAIDLGVLLRVGQKALLKVIEKPQVILNKSTIIPFEVM